MQRKGSGARTLFLASAGIVFCANRLAEVIGDRSGGMLLFGLLVLGGVAMAIPSHYERAKWITIFIGLPGTAVGTIVDVLWDAIINSVDRNLWPFEILIWWVGSVIAMTCGHFVGRQVLRSNAQT